MLAHAYVLAGECHEAHRLIANDPVLGWSHGKNPQGLVVSFSLVLLSGRPSDALSSNLEGLWQSVLQSSLGLHWASRQDDVLQRLVPAYAECLRKASLRRDEQDKMLSACLDIAKRRVDEIVSNQYRDSYNKAAMLIVACAEVLRLRGEEEGARELLDEVRARFPRHRSFQAELKVAVERMEASIPG